MILINQEGTALKELRKNSRGLVPVIYCCVTNLPKGNEMKQELLYMFTEAVGQKFRQGTAGVPCLCLSWEDLKWEA